MSSITHVCGAGDLSPNTAKLLASIGKIADKACVSIKDPSKIEHTEKIIRSCRYDECVENWGASYLLNRVVDETLPTPVRLGCLAVFAIISPIRFVLMDCPLSLRDHLDSIVDNEKNNTFLRVTAAAGSMLSGACMIPALFVGGTLNVLAQRMPITEEIKADLIERAAYTGGVDGISYNQDLFERRTIETQTRQVGDRTGNVLVFKGSEEDRKNLLNELQIVKETIKSAYPELNFDKQHWFQNLDTVWNKEKQTYVKISDLPCLKQV